MTWVTAAALVLTGVVGVLVSDYAWFGFCFLAATVVFGVLEVAAPRVPTRRR